MVSRGVAINNFFSLASNYRITDLCNNIGKTCSFPCPLNFELNVHIFELNSIGKTTFFLILKYFYPSLEKANSNCADYILLYYRKAGCI
jgi:hypothetical protein